MTRVAPLLAVLLASLLARAAPQASIRCTWTKVWPSEAAHSSFLRQDSASVRLYHSVWSEERALLSCSWSDDAAVIHNYLTLCRERTQEFPDKPDGNYNLDPGDLDECVSLPSPDVVGHGERAGSRPARSLDGLTISRGHDKKPEVAIHQRVKRGFIVPGTLWCGSGNKAPSYEDLGVFTDTDSCCREHDQCKHTILSFHSDFGVFNSNIFTMSHCECDNRFRRCLMEANDSIAHAVGYTFFNLLKMHCFEFSHRLQCSQRNWFGLCKESKMALYAEVHPPMLFESIGPTDNSNSSTSNTTTALKSASSSTGPSPPPSSSTGPSREPSSSTGSSPPPSASTDPSPPLSASITTVPSVTTSIVDSTSGLTGSGNERPSLTEQDAAGRPWDCGIYQDLDQCRNTIPPHETKLGLDNPEARTLYHCNCTSRLFQTLSEPTRMSHLQVLLLDRVSLSCFVLQDCTAGNTCTAVLVRPVEDQRHLQAVRLKVRPKPSRVKKKGRAVTLHKLCLRMSRKIKSQRREENGSHLV